MMFLKELVLSTSQRPPSFKRLIPLVGVGAQAREEVCDLDQGFEMRLTRSYLLDPEFFPQSKFKCADTHEIANEFSLQARLIQKILNRVPIQTCIFIWK